ncbi:hypothetical protein BVRB_7g163330 [Beta vulgaris subsp. vulgaris]|uniref:Uncharacterized protein n=1 Tax=Beta vulgaris subsp. vulgaris TaxID=3555 RepID=A0A0J8ESH6_BETVV|nr:hypothetical protein BVRB_7g163330 [Beta vulgaris subsp. vulgaris]
MFFGLYHLQYCFVCKLEVSSSSPRKFLVFIKLDLVLDLLKS